MLIKNSCKALIINYKGEVLKGVAFKKIDSKYFGVNNNDNYSKLKRRNNPPNDYRLNTD